MLDDWGELNSNSNQELVFNRLLIQSWSFLNSKLNSFSLSRLNYSGNIGVCVGETYKSNNYVFDSSSIAGDSLVFSFSTRGKSSISPIYIENFTHIHSIIYISLFLSV